MPTVVRSAALGAFDPKQIHFLQQLVNFYPGLVAAELSSLPLGEYEEGKGPAFKTAPISVLDEDE
eukprot:5173093-Prymnesium_polylepis.1